MKRESTQLALIGLALLVCMSLYFLIPDKILAHSPRLTLSFVIMAIILYALQLLPSGYTSIVILMLFSIFDLAPPNVIFSLWLSPMIYLVISAFFLAKAVEKSGLAQRLALYMFRPFVKNYRTLIILIYGVGIIFSLIIPHPFARAFIMLAIVKSIWDQMELSKEERASVGLSVFVAASVNSFIFLTGDSVLNISTAELAGEAVTWLGWFILMGPPSIGLNILVCLTHLLVFRPKTKSQSLEFKDDQISIKPMNMEEKKVLFWLTLAIILWATDLWHGIHPAWVGVIAITGLAMPRIGGLLKAEDFKAVPIDILFFMTAALAIGNVVVHTTLSETLANWIMPDLALANPMLIGLLLTAIGIFIHFFVGSAFALISLLIPIFVTYLEAFSIEPMVGAMIIYLCSKAQWFFPFHLMDVMIGLGEKNGGYTQKPVVILGSVMIVPLLISVALFYIPWWQWIDAFYTK
ncbi:SLC13 family permease [Bacillus sp. M6-12]|uniref:SLC13 family permease n=1 Tax=Bacillus sp. M6-12 TaxID=2054166 RepID=UPI0015E085B6|nr:SLC13 family permease [Bacillus sp. M6-12]